MANTKDAWEKDPNAAYTEALHRSSIAATSDEPEVDENFNVSDLTELETLPPEIGTLTRLKRLKCQNLRESCRLSDISALRNAGKSHKGPLR